MVDQETEDVLADLDHVVDVDGERLTVSALIERYRETSAERDMLAEAVETFGLQPAPLMQPSVKRPTPAPHGTLNPTDGRTGTTTPVTKE